MPNETGAYFDACTVEQGQVGPVIVFGTLTILFFLLAYGDFTAASADFKHFTGYEGLICGFAAIYTGLAQVLNELFGKIILPLGMVKK